MPRGGDSRRTRVSSDVENRRHREILLRRRRSECNRGLNIFRLQAGEGRQHVGDQIALRKTGKHGSKSHTRSPEHRLSAANLAVADDALVEVATLEICPAHARPPALPLILALGLAPGSKGWDSLGFPVCQRRDRSNDVADNTYLARHIAKNTVGI